MLAEASENCHPWILLLGSIKDDYLGIEKQPHMS